MMKRTSKMALMLPLVASLCCGNIYATHKKHNGFVAGACAIGAGLLAAAGAVALVDLYYSETDDQLIARIDGACRSIDSEYKQTMDYFGPRAGVGNHAPQRPIQSIQEAVLFEFSTYLWNLPNVTQAGYRSGVRSAKHTLQSCVKDLRKRIHSLESTYLTYEDQRRLSTMRQLLSNAEMLLADITLFSDCLECHKTYLNLYETVGTIHERYAYLIDIVTSGRYTAAAEIKQYVLNYSKAQYPFILFVEAIDRDIATVQSTINVLAYSYESGRNSAHTLLNRLMMIRNILVSDPQYQEELYQRLERQRMETFEAQVRLERERIRVLQQQNRILEERNRIERQKAWQQGCYVPTSEIVIEVTV